MGPGFIMSFHHVSFITHVGWAGGVAVGPRLHHELGHHLSSFITYLSSRTLGGRVDWRLGPGFIGPDSRWDEVLELLGPPGEARVEPMTESTGRNDQSPAMMTESTGHAGHGESACLASSLSLTRSLLLLALRSPPLRPAASQMTSVWSDSMRGIWGLEGARVWVGSDSFDFVRFRCSCTRLSSVTLEASKCLGSVGYQGFAARVHERDERYGTREATSRTRLSRFRRSCTRA